MPQFNIPKGDDPDFNDKVTTLLGELFDTQESQFTTLPPIDEPEDGLQVGSIYFDKTSGKLKVKTEAGIKTITFDP